jgi:hypothetical protein
MSHEASGWAFRQELPAKVKIVLVALADQASEINGHVCYGRRHMKYLAKKSSCGERTLYRYLAALIRNGYLLRDSGKAKGQENELYLQMDREAASYGKWTWKAGEPEANEADDDPQDIAAGSAKSEGGSAKTEEDKSAHFGIPGLPHRVAESESLESTKEHRPADEKPLIGFSRQAQELERASGRAQAQKNLEPGEIPSKTFVQEGTRWWKAYAAYKRSIGRPANQTMPGIGKYRGKTGRYVDTELLQKILKQPSTAGPEKISKDGVNEEAAAEFAAAINR